MQPMSTITAVKAVKADRSIKKLGIEHSEVTVDVGGTAEASTFSPSYRTPDTPYDEATFQLLYAGKYFTPLDGNAKVKDEVKAAKPDAD